MAAAPIDHLVAGARITPAAHDRHPLALFGVAPDGPLELSCLVLDQSAHDRHVRPAQRPVLELGRKRAVARIVAGDDDQAGRALVEPVDDARTRHAPDERPATAAAQQRVHQRAGVVAGRRVDDHARRLVDDRQVVVLVNDLEWNRLRRGFGYVSLRDLELHDVARHHAVRRVGGLAVDPHEVALDQARGGRPAQVLRRARRESGPAARPRLSRSGGWSF